VISHFLNNRVLHDQVLAGHLRSKGFSCIPSGTDTP
jgi:hypothetical protein